MQLTMPHKIVSVLTFICITLSFWLIHVTNEPLPTETRIAPTKSVPVSHSTPINITAISAPPSHPIATNKSAYSQLSSFIQQPKSDTSINTIQLIECGLVCLSMLEQQLVSDSLSMAQLNILNQALSQGQHVQIAQVLLSSLEKRIHQNGYDEQSAVIAKTLLQFNTTSTAKEAAVYLSSHPNASAEVKSVLSELINNTPNRQLVAQDIVSLFATATDTGKESLLSIAQPESLAILSQQAQTHSQIAQYQQVMERLQASPSEHSVDVFLDLAKTAESIENKDAILLAAQTWAYQQLSGNRLDFIEDKLTKNELSDEDKELVFNMLAQAEDQHRAQDILAKFNASPN